ncbi:T9SS type A sorting domain-containing protein [Flaviaesturariibacter flavus]|uniref:T9SS type A sorting domain-containing protein n=1 Tax=Flaviaesturariibacter flavus TaxID=2502780 RepID=A0A4R1BB77_9BACT|nr:T9SS type A sorting domain-containing protein [Flaviaesturariibacter flavus]TCJ14214.1 T9SS type A sorting domain-containing protein [Flaviaesturariibacter flavus]
MKTFACIRKCNAACTAVPRLFGHRSHKRAWLLGLVLTPLAALHAQTTSVFSQDFNGASAAATATASTYPAFTNAAYVNASTPGTTLFTHIVGGGQSASTLQFNTTTNGGVAGDFVAVSGGSSFQWALLRNVNLAAAPSVLKLKFRCKIDVGSTGSTSKLWVQVGSGFANEAGGSTAPTKPADPLVHSGFSFRFSNGTNGATVFDNTGSSNTGFTTSNITENYSEWTMIVNNSGSTYTYTDTTGATQTLANDKYDLFKDNVQFANDIAATTGTTAINQFKIGAYGTSSVGTGTFYLSWITAETIACSAPTLSGISQAGPVCSGADATINLTGLPASSPLSVSYNINGAATQTAALTSNASGAGTLSVPLTLANNGQTLTVTGISYAYCSSSFASNNSTMLSVAAAPATPANPAGAARCGAGTLTLSVDDPGAGLTVNWYDQSTGGNQVGTGASFTTPSLSATTTYYAELLNGGGCSSASRAAATATINTVPAITPGTAIGAAGATSAALAYTSSGTPTLYSINWDAGALAAGFANVNSTALSSSPLSLVTPAGASAGSYSGTITPATASCVGSPTAFSVTLNGPYTWTGAINSTDFTNMDNWSPQRATPTTADRLIFDGATAVITTMPAGQSIGSLVIRNNANVSFAHSAATTLTISNGLSVEAGSTLTQGSNVSLALNGGSSNIAGTYKLNSGTFNVTGATAVIVTGSFDNASTSATAITSSASVLQFASGNGVGTFNLLGNGGQIPQATWTTIADGNAVHSTINVTGVTSAANITATGSAAGTYGNLNFDMPGLTTAGYKVFNNAGAFVSGVTIAGNLTFGRTGSGSIQMTSGTPFTINVGGNVNVYAGSWNLMPFSGSNGTAIINIAGNLNIDGTQNYAATGYSRPIFNLSSARAGNTGTINLSGNLYLNSGANVAELAQTLGAGSINFTGSAGKTISVLNGSVLSGAVKLNIAKTGGASMALASNLAQPATGQLAFTSGILDLGAFNLTAGSVSGGSTSAYARTSGAGVFKMQAVPNSATLFPVGNSSYNPVQLTNGGGLDWTVQVATGISNVGAGVAARSIDRSWSITPSTNPTPAAATVRVYYNGASDGNASFTNSSNSQLWQNVSGTWTPRGASQSGQQDATVGNLNYVEAGGLQSFSTFIVSNITAPASFNVTGAGVYCDGTGRTLGVSGSESDISYQLKKNGSNQGSAVAGTGSALSFGTQPAGSYTVTATNAFGYEVTSAPATITDAGLFSVQLSVAQPVLCATGSTTINVTGGPSNGSITYAANGGTPQTATLDASGAATIATGTLSATTTFRVSAVSNGTCATAVNTAATVYVGSITASGLSNRDFCAGATVPAQTFSGNLPAGTQFTWVINGGTAIGMNASDTTGTGTMLPAFTAANATSQQLSAIVSVSPVITAPAGCRVLTATYRIRVNPMPQVSFVSGENQTVCAGSATAPIGLQGSQATGMTFRWTSSNTAVGSLATGAASSTAPAIASFIAQNSTGNTSIQTIYAVTPYLGSCSGPAISTTLTVNRSVVSLSYVGSPICGSDGAASGPRLNGSTGGTYSYINLGTGTATGLALNASTGVITPLQSVAGNYQVSYTLAGAAGACGGSVSAPVTITPRATLAGVSNRTVCPGVPQSLVFTSPQDGLGLSYIWTVSTTSGVSPAALGFTATAGSTNTINFTPVNNTGLPQRVTVSVKATPPNGSGYCASTTATFAVTINASCSIARSGDNSAGGSATQRTRTAPSNPEEATANAVTVGPNPTQSRVTVYLNAELQRQGGSWSVQLLSQQGAPLLKGASFAASRYTLDLSGQPAGVYVLQLVNRESGRIIRKQVVKL